MQKVLSLFQRHRTEVMFFGALFVYYLMGITPDMTWMSQGGDGFDYVIGSKHFWAVRPTGYPVLIILGWFAEHILPGNDFWKLGFISAVSAWLTCIFIFKLARLLLDKFPSEFSKMYGVAPYAAALTYAASFLVWTQAGIPEVYTLCTLLMVMAVYFAIKERWVACALVLAVGVGTHHLIAFAVFAIGAYACYRHMKGQIKIKLWLYPLIIGVGFLTYLQVYFAQGPQETTSGLGTVESQSLGSIGFVFGLPLTETWERIKEAFPMMLTGLGLGYLVLPLVVKKQRSAIYLIWTLVVIHFAYYFFSNIPMWVVYLVPAFAFGAVLVGYGLPRLRYRWAPVAFVLAPLIFMGCNLAFYDIGNTVDKVPTGARQLVTELDSIPDNAIVYLNRWGEPWLETYYYWTENPRFDFIFEGEMRFHPISYAAYKESLGVVIPRCTNTGEITDWACYGTTANNTLYYTSWNNSLFLEDLCELNPGRPVYIIQNREGRTFEELAYGFGEYNCSCREENLIEESSGSSTNSDCPDSVDSGMLSGISNYNAW